MNLEPRPEGESYAARLTKGQRILRYSLAAMLGGFAVVGTVVFVRRGDPDAGVALLPMWLWAAVAIGVAFPDHAARLGRRLRVKQIGDVLEAVAGGAASLIGLLIGCAIALFLLAVVLALAIKLLRWLF